RTGDREGYLEVVDSIALRLLPARKVADGSKQALVVKPRYPFEGGQFHGCLGLPGHSSVNQLRFVQTVDVLNQRVVIGTSGAADRWADTGFAQAVRMPNGYVLRLPIGVMNKPVGFGRPAIIHGLLQRIQNE